jgi:hypothetical protein
MPLSEGEGVHSPVSAPSPAPVSPQITDLITAQKGAIHKTSQRFIYLDGTWSADLRKHCKANGTTIASTLIVLALGAIRATFGPGLAARQVKLPRHQGTLTSF